MVADQGGIKLVSVSIPRFACERFITFCGLVPRNQTLFSRLSNTAHTRPDVLASFGVKQIQHEL